MEKCKKWYELSDTEANDAREAFIAENAITPETMELLEKMREIRKEMEAKWVKAKWRAKLIANREAAAQQEGPCTAMYFVPGNENELFLEVVRELEEESAK